MAKATGTADRRGQNAKEKAEKDMENLVKCVGVLFGINDSTSPSNGLTEADEVKPFIPGMRKKPNVTVTDETKTKLPYQKGAITEIFRNLGYSVDTSTSDGKKLVHLLFPPRVDRTGTTGPLFKFKGDREHDLRKHQSSRMHSQNQNVPSSSKASMPILNKDVRKNFTPPRLKSSYPSSRDHPRDEVPFNIGDEDSPPKSTGDVTILNAFCKKLSTHPTGGFENNVPAFGRSGGTSGSILNNNSKQDLLDLQQNASGTTATTAGTLTSFKTAHEQMIIDDKGRGIKRSLPSNQHPSIHVSGLRKVPRIDNENSPNGTLPKKVPIPKTDSEDVSENSEVQNLMMDERLKNVEPKMVEAVLNEIIENETNTQWDDIAGLSGPKAVIKEIIIWPLQRPDIFTGLRGPPKGVLLFGPPGTGKTMIGRLIATQSNSTFFNISASSLTSKWIGDGEKMVRALFQVARVKQPSVIFIDEIDSILTHRSDTEHESSRRLKTEFLIQFDGCGTAADDKILVIGVTNRPQELDEAARRRLAKRIYIPLPDTQSRKHLVKRVLEEQNASLSEEDFQKVAEITEGYSGADMSSLVREAAYGPIRDVGEDITSINVENVRPILLKDFEIALKRVKASVSPQDLSLYEDWDSQFGCHV